MNNQPDTWKRIESEEVANCRIFKVRQDTCVRLNDGAEHNFFVLENTDWVNIIPFTTNDEVVLIEQFRHGIEALTLEIPGGMVDDDEDPQIAATRELIEETGYKPREVVFLGKTHPNPATHDNTVYHYLALGCEKVQEVEFDSTESIVTSLVSLDNFSELITSEKITHSLVVAAFCRYLLYKQGVK